MSLDRPASTPSPARASTGRIVAIYALLGPLVGCFALMTIMMMSGTVPVAADGVFFGVVLAAGYILGIAPAALTGFAVARSRRSGLPSAILGLFIGAALAALFSLLVFGGLPRTAAMFATMGAISGLVCGIVSDLWTA